MNSKHISFEIQLFATENCGKLNSKAIARRNAHHEPHKQRTRESQPDLGHCGQADRGLQAPRIRRGHFADDGAVVGGIARLDGRPVTVIGIQKGKNLQENRFNKYDTLGMRKSL